MISTDAKLFLIKALIEGLACNLPSVDAMTEFVETFKTVLEENPRVKGNVVGDVDGLIVEDDLGLPIASIIVTGKVIKFNPLISETELEAEHAELLSRTIIAAVSALLIEEQKRKVIVGNETEEEFNHNDFGIIK